MFMEIQLNKIGLNKMELVGLNDKLWTVSFCW